MEDAHMYSHQPNIPEPAMRPMTDAVVGTVFIVVMCVLVALGVDWVTGWIAPLADATFWMWFCFLLIAMIFMFVHDGAMDDLREQLVRMRKQ